MGFWSLSTIRTCSGIPLPSCNSNGVVAPSTKNDSYRGAKPLATTASAASPESIVETNEKRPSAPVRTIRLLLGKLRLSKKYTSAFVIGREVFEASGVSFVGLLALLA